MSGTTESSRPNSKLRRRVVPVFEPKPVPVSTVEAPSGTKAPQPKKAYRIPWAELLRRVFAQDVSVCPECNDLMKVIAFIPQVAVARRILDHLDLDSTGPPIARAQGPPELFDPGPDYSADPVFIDP